MGSSRNNGKVGIKAESEGWSWEADLKDRDLEVPPRLSAPYLTTYQRLSDSILQQQGRTIATRLQREAQASGKGLESLKGC